MTTTVAGESVNACVRKEALLPSASHHPKLATVGPAAAEYSAIFSEFLMVA